MKVFFLGDGAWASESFKQLLDRGGEIVGVVLRKRVTEEEFPNLVRKHAAKVFQDVDVNSESFAATIESLRAEILVCVSYDQIMKPEFLKRFPKGAWNLHASKLPKYRGRAAVYWALINGEQEIGVTFHEIAPKVDTGRILIQEMVPVTEDDDLGTMLPKLAKVAGEIVAKGVGLIDKGDYELREQVGDPSYCRRRKAGDEIIDWNWSSQRVLNFVRGLTRPGPGATTQLDGQSIKIWKAKIQEMLSVESSPGKIRVVESGEVRIATSDGWLEIVDAEYPSGMDVSKLDGVSLV